MSFHVPEKLRIHTGPMGSDASAGNNGAFLVRCNHGQWVNVIASDGMGWEHVSVSRRDRVPNWDEMCRIKALFWDDEDVVIQFHPRVSDYVNLHPNCLHLWRPIGVELPTPLPLLVGPQGSWGTR